MILAPIQREFSEQAIVQDEQTEEDSDGYETVPKRASEEEEGYGVKMYPQKNGDALLLTKQLMEPSNSDQDQSQQVFTEMFSIYAMVEISIIEKVFSLAKAVRSAIFQFLDGSYSGPHIS